VLNGVLWVLRTGAPWHDLPDRYPPYQTCHRRFQQWRKNGVFRDLLTCLAEDLRLRGKIDLTEGFIDASFTAAKKGALSSVLQSAAKGNQIMAIVDRRSLPLAVHVACASPHEVRLDRDCKNFEATSLARPTADELFSVCDSGARRRRGDRSPGRWGDVRLHPLVSRRP
jgi:hypothetical protein